MPAELTVTAVGFSPVKGTAHLRHDRVELDRQGPVGDRRWCLVDVGSQRVLRTVQHPALIGVVARTVDDALCVTLPSGESVTASPEPSGEALSCDYWGRPVELALTDGPHSAVLSHHLGRNVRLARAPRGAVVFAAPVTMLATASLGELGLLEEAARFRANLVVETDEPWVEDAWLGRTFAVGAAEVLIGAPIPRCAVIDHHPATGIKDRRLLKELAASRPTNRAGEPMFGVYAEVVRPGAVPETRTFARDGSISPPGAHTGVK